MALSLCWLWPIIILRTSSLEDVDQFLRVADDEIELQQPLLDLDPALFLVASVLLDIQVLRLRRLS